MKAEAMALKSQKEQADKDSSNAKSLISRLNKEVSSQKSSMEAFKKALERSKQENEKLSKSLTTNKKIAEAQAAVKKSEEALKTKTAELESANKVSKQSTNPSNKYHDLIPTFLKPPMSTAC